MALSISSQSSLSQARAGRSPYLVAHVSIRTTSAHFYTHAHLVEKSSHTHAIQFEQLSRELAHIINCLHSISALLYAKLLWEKLLPNTWEFYKGTWSSALCNRGELCSSLKQIKWEIVVPQSKHLSLVRNTLFYTFQTIYGYFMLK